MGDKDNGFVSFTSSAMALTFKEENKQGQAELRCLTETKHSREDDDKKQRVDWRWVVRSLSFCFCLLCFGGLWGKA
ncbi:hypothetical protein ACFX2B_009193 [Malus domestica]